MAASYSFLIKRTQDHLMKQNPKETNKQQNNKRTISLKLLKLRLILHNNLYREYNLYFICFSALLMTSKNQKLKISKQTNKQKTMFCFVLFCFSLHTQRFSLKWAIWRWYNSKQKAFQHIWTHPIKHTWRARLKSYINVLVG